MATDQDKRRAHQLAHKAVLSGQIVQARECADCHTILGKLVAHHSDYSQPLVVEWLCRVCHRRRHNEIYLAEKRRERVSEQLSLYLRARMARR
jgi:hypothetical protein